MAFLKPFEPSADYVVVKAFIESGIAYKVGDKYVPRFNSSKRKFRQYIARKIERAEAKVETPVEDVVTEDAPVKEAPAKKKTTRKTTTKKVEA